MSPDPPESAERHISVWKIERRRKIKNPQNSSGIFLQFSQFSEILGKSGKKARPNPSAQKFILRKTRGSIFWISSEFVRIRLTLEKEKMIFFQFFSHFLEIHFSCISTESDVLWCIGGPQFSCSGKFLPRAIYPIHPEMFTN